MRFQTLRLNRSIIIVPNIYHKILQKYVLFFSRHKLTKVYSETTFVAAAGYIPKLENKLQRLFHTIYI